jgi:hypothetical protein
MPVYNGAAFLRKAIDSILSQTFGDFEFLIVDDGSEDETPDIVREYAARDGRIRVVWGGRRGLVATLNDGLAQASCDIVARMDQDDVAYPERFERQYRRLVADDGLWVLGTRWDTITPGGKRRRAKKRQPTSAAEIARRMPEKCVLIHPSVMMRRDRIIGIGGYRAAYQHADDYDLWLRVIEKGRIENLDWVGLSYRGSGIINKSWQGSLRQMLSADLARATHRLRLAGLDDPTDGMQAAPPILEPSVLDALMAESIGFYRVVHQALSGPLTAETAHALMRAASRLPHSKLRRHKRIAQLALVELLKARSRWDVPMALGALSALSLNPARFARMAAS